MYNFPIDVADNTYDASSFEGRRYVQSYPELLSDWVETAKNKELGYCSNLFIPVIGYIELQSSRYRRWAPGHRLLFTDYSGGVTTKFVLHVYTYDYEKGTLTGFIDATTSGPAPLVKWKVEGRVHVKTVDIVDNAAGVVDGGLYDGGVFQKLDNVFGPGPMSGADIFNDFNTFHNTDVNNSYGYPVKFYKTGHANAANSMTLLNPDTAENVCGILTQQTYSSGDIVTVLHANDRGFYLIDNSFSMRMEWEARIYIPTLSNGTHRYMIQAGLTAKNSTSETDLFSYAGVGFRYKDDVNSGQWVLVYGATSSVSTINSSIAVTTGWHKLKMVWAAGTLTYYVDGVSAGTRTTGLPFLASGSSNNSLLPGIQIIRSVGNTTVRSIIIDYYSLRFRSNARRN